MISPPTDNLYKFMAVSGLVVIFSSVTFWWQARNNFDIFFEENTDYVNSIFEGSEAYEKFATKTNEGITIINNVSGNIKSLSEAQREQLDKILAESEILKIEAGAIIKSNPATRIAMNTQMEKYNLAEMLSILGVISGTLISAFGFYLWHFRLQRYIDHLHRSGNA